jgi:hypothetical protein
VDDCGGHEGGGCPYLGARIRAGRTRYALHTKANLNLIRSNRGSFGERSRWCRQCNSFASDSLRGKGASLCQCQSALLVNLHPRETKGESSSASALPTSSIDALVGARLTPARVDGADRSRLDDKNAVALRKFLAELTTGPAPPPLASQPRDAAGHQRC